MTAYEIVTIILAVASLMVAVGMFVVALLTFLDKREISTNKNAYPV